MEHSHKRNRSDGSNAVLNSLDPRKFTSQIPTAITAAKRRNSGTGTSSLNMGLSDMVNQSIANNLKGKPDIQRRSFVEPRKSLLSERKSLRLSQRTSLLPSTGTYNTSGNTSNRDPRPLRDKNFQAVLQQEVLGYLALRKFDIETNHPISLKSLKQPTQKDFIYIFKWLYLRIDPGHNFTKSLEHEVYSILRIIQYPYLETINKSQISAVGGSNWPKFLGMLHWLVVINKKLDKCLVKLDTSITSQNTQELTVLNQPLKTLDEQDDKQEKYELMVERLFIDYIMQAYKSFLRLEDNYAPFMNELELGFERFVHIIQTDIDNLSKQNDELSLKCQDMVERGQELRVAKNKFTAFQSDLTKFQNYVNAMEHKSHEWPRKLQQIETEISTRRKQIKDTEMEISNLRQSLREKNISIDEIDSKNNERDALSKSLDAAANRLDQLVSSVRVRKFEAEGVCKVLLDTLKQYQSAVESLVIARSNLGHEIDPKLFQFSLPDGLLLDEKLGLRPDDLLPAGMTINRNIRNHLLSLNEQILERIQTLQKENAVLESNLENLKDEINEKTEQLESMESRLSNAKSEYEEYKQETQSQLLSQRIEVEKLERKIQNSKNTSQQKLSQAEQEARDAKVKHDELKHSINRERSALHSKVIRLIEYVSNFKISVQSSIENMEVLTTQELQKVRSSQ